MRRLYNCKGGSRDDRFVRTENKWLNNVSLGKKRNATQRPEHIRRAFIRKTQQVRLWDKRVAPADLQRTRDEADRRRLVDDVADFLRSDK